MCWCSGAQCKKSQGTYLTYLIKWMGRGKEQKQGYFAYVTVVCVYVSQLLVVASSKDHPLLNGATALSLRLTKI